MAGELTVKDIDKMSSKELQAELEKRKHSSFGSKPELKKSLLKLLDLVPESRPRRGRKKGNSNTRNAILEDEKELEESNGTKKNSRLLDKIRGLNNAFEEGTDTKERMNEARQQLKQKVKAKEAEKEEMLKNKFQETEAKKQAEEAQRKRRVSRIGT